MYTLFNWIDHRYHPSGWIKLGVFALFVLGALAKAAEDRNKKQAATGSSTDPDHGRRPDK